MFHVVVHTNIVYSGELSQVTRYVIEHYGLALDQAIRSGIKISYTEGPGTAASCGMRIPDQR